MTIREWQQLAPAEAAREVLARVRTRLSPPQQRAAIALLPAEPELARRFAEAVADAPLARIPFFAKDLFDSANEPTFAGSRFLPEIRPPRGRDGAFISAVREAGGVLAGKTHLHEFAYGITGENPHYGDCEHPRFPGRTTGGSSSGSAAAVAAGIVPLALATDTGGSVRVPAAFCGLFGFRLTPHHDWIKDAVALAPSFDTAGWFTATADDMRLAVGELVGSEPLLREPCGCYLEFGDLDPEVATACRRGAETFARPADPSVAADLRPAFAATLAAYHTIVAREAWAVHREWEPRFRARYDPNVAQRLARAHSLTIADHAAADATLARIRLVWDRYFSTFDFLVMPATPCAALTKADCTLANRNRLITLTAPASLGGLPLLTVPVRLPSGLSTGLQIIVREPRSAVVPWAIARAT